MLKHNLKLFLRNIKHNKSTFLINTLGLGIGIASFLTVALYVYNDLTYNHFNENLANIYRIQEVYQDGKGMQTKGVLLPQMEKEIPEIVNGTRIFDWDGYRLSHKDAAFPENVYYVDEGFFSVFTFPFLEGSASKVLDEKFTAVVSKPFAEKYFGTASAVGKQLRVGFEDVFLTVNGVVDIPENSSVKFDIVTSYDTGETISPWVKDVHDWYNTFSDTYVVLQDGIRPDDIAAKLDNIVKENFLPVGENTTKIGLLSFSEYHAEAESNRTLILILAFIALGILGIAIVNFINLTITNSLSRTKEIGIKKVHGALKHHVVQQIMVESFGLGLMALAFGLLLLTTVLLPAFNSLFEMQLTLQSFDLWVLGLLLLGIWLTVGLFSGTVPSFLWARGRLVESLKGKISSRGRPSTSKYASIIVQFVIAIVLISGTFLVRKQIDYMLTKNPKFDSENVIVAETNFWQHEDIDAAARSFEVIAKEMEASPYVASVSFTGTVPGDYDENYNTFYPEAKSTLPNISLRKAYVGKDYFKTLGIPVLNGHGFDTEAASLENTVVLNKTAMDQLGFQQAEGQIIREANEDGQPYRIVGVIDDFSYQGVQTETQALAHFYTEQENYANWDYLTVRAKKGAALQVISLLEGKWNEMLPHASLSHFFSDEKLNIYYKEYERVNTLITWFSILAVILSCMGLFALASYAMARRTKEIGIRKVNGATIAQILALLNKDFLKWVVIAFVIAVPVSWYAMHQWLEGFAYKTSISWWIFALAGCTAVAIALLTVSWQSFRAATANPVDALRDE